MNPFTEKIDPDSFDYSRGVKIVVEDGKIRFRPVKPLALDQVEATCDWFDHLDEPRIRRDDEDEMTQKELQEHTDDWHDSH